MKRLALLAALFVPAATLAQEQEGPPLTATETVWEVRYKGKSIGSEKVSEQNLEGGGLVLRSKGNIKLPTAPRFEFEQKLEHDAKGFLRFELTSPMITTSAARTAEGVTVKRVYLGNEGKRDVPGKGPFLCLDNLVWCHYDMLAREAVLQKNEAFVATYLVPQGQAGIPARFEPGEQEQAKLGDAACSVRTGRLALAGVLVEVTYDVERGRALRVVIPAQQFEAIVRGFVPPGEAETTPTDVRWREEEVSIPAPQGPLPGTLTLPLAETPGPYPALILLHGSGPNDRDETIGPNKPFRDLAHGLAARGIATLRYDKRTLLLQKQFFAGGEEAKKAAKTLETLTLKEESIDDGVAALAWLAGREEIKQRFVLGHSLGALAAPEVAAKVEGLAGVVLMAAPGRGLDEIVMEQLVYKQTLGGISEEEARKQVEEGLGKQWRQLRAGELPDMARIMGATVYYWKDILARSDAGKILAQCKRPVLLLHGSKDYQVTRADYDKLKAALESREGIPHEARWFEGLNHLFMPVKGLSTGAEYMIEGKMAPDVVELVAAWVKKTAG